MAEDRKPRRRRTASEGIQMTTGEPEDGLETPASKRSRFFGALRRVARDAVIRRTSTKG